MKLFKDRQRLKPNLETEKQLKNIKNKNGNVATMRSSAVSGNIIVQRYKNDFSSIKHICYHVTFHFWQSSSYKNIMQNRLLKHQKMFQEETHLQTRIGTRHLN